MDWILDHAGLREVVKGPGADTRQWMAHGTVVIGTEAQHPVRFDADDGTPLPHGVLVDVKLQPSGIEVPCRVANDCAGAGEGEFHPFVDGDEVLVAIPGGDERGGCVIVKRMNQSLDTFPRLVAGMDVTQNTVAFKRTRAPYALESGTAIVLRVASNGAGLTLDPTGQVFLVSGDGSGLVMTPDACSFQLKDLAAGFQLDASKKQATVIAGGSTLVVDDQDSEFQTAGTLKVTTAGNGAAEHVTTVEAVLGILNAIGQTIAGPITGGGLVAALPTIVAAASVAPLPALLSAAIGLAFSKPKVAGTPNVGCPGFLAS